MHRSYNRHINDPTKSNVLTIKDRKTGLLMQEYIPSYVTVAFQLMYQNAAARSISSGVITQDILKKMSKDKGTLYDTEESRKEIESFIKTYNIDTSILNAKDISEFDTMNDFFARSIDFKAHRPMPDNEKQIVSPADCRMMVFNSILDSTRFWIKGSQFTLEKLLGSERSEIVPNFESGAFCIARLAPQDYHRWHWPVSGTITKITPVDGGLFTVNPFAINKDVNVYTENKRCIVEIDSNCHGQVILVAMAATMVGSYILFQKDNVILEEQMTVERGEVAGEFRFGGSTILLLFKAGAIEWEQDLLTHSKENLETLLLVRESIGHSANA